MKLAPFPGVGLVVVALGALDLDAHEDPRDLAGHLDGPGLVRQRERDGPVLVVAAGGGDHAGDDRIPGRVGLQPLGDPIFERVESDPVQVFVGGVETDHVAPVVGPVAGVFGGARASVSISRERLSLAWSRRNDSTWTGVGGWPITSK